MRQGFSGTYIFNRKIQYIPDDIACLNPASSWPCELWSPHIVLRINCEFKDKKLLFSGPRNLVAGPRYTDVYALR